MSDLLGADLQAGSQSSDFDATPVSHQPASPGFERDALGNEYRVEPRQGSAQATTSGGTEAAAQAQPGTLAGASLNEQAGVGKESSAPVAPPAPDPRVMAAVQEAMSRAAAAEQRLQQIEQAEFERKISSLPREQQDLVRYQRALQLREAQINEAARRQVQTQQQMDQTVHKETVVVLLSQKYGVPAERLRSFSTPEGMEEFAKAVSEIRRENKTQQQTQASTAVTAGQGNPPPASWKQTRLTDALASIFD